MQSSYYPSDAFINRGGAIAVAVKHVDAVYLSPHLDDAAFSCGGQISQAAAAGAEIVIATLMAGEPPAGPVGGMARRVLARGRPFRRRQEDLRACLVLGCGAAHLAAPDCVFRLDPATRKPLYASRASVFGPPAAADSGMIAELCAELERLFAPCDVVAPLGVGGHVDHLITRQVGEIWGGETVRYYEDFPYIEEPGSLEAALGAPEDWIGEVIPLSPQAMKARVCASGCFRTQAGMDGRLGLRMIDHILQTGGERLWRRRPASSDGARLEGTAHAGHDPGPIPGCGLPVQSHG
ncbi:MAG: PIG-L family deacetylase, partial [Acidobacteriota bacterium]